MGQKVNPIIFRMGMSQGWRSKWFSEKNYIEYLQKDIAIRKYLQKKLKDAGVASVEIRRSADEVNISIYSSRPGIIIGRGGTGIEDLKKEIKNKFIKEKINLRISIEEVRKPMLSAAIVSQSIIEQIEKRIPYRKVMKKAIERVMEAGAKGVRVIVAGRLNGVEIARTETLNNGNLPLHTIRADIDYSRGVASTTYGAIGVKVWIYKGSVLEKEDDKSSKQESKKSINQ